MENENRSEIEKRQKEIDAEVRRMNIEHFKNLKPTKKPSIKNDTDVTRPALIGWTGLQIVTCKNCGEPIIYNFDLETYLCSGCGAIHE